MPRSGREDGATFRAKHAAEHALKAERALKAEHALEYGNAGGGFNQQAVVKFRYGK